MKLYKMIEIYLKYDNIHTIGIINAFICFNNHINSCINGMLSINKSSCQLLMCQATPRALGDMMSI